MSVKVTLDSIAKEVEKRTQSANLRLCESVLSSCEEYVPYKTGKLCSSGKTDGNSVKWTAEHARKCYYGNAEFSKSVHPRATSRWFEAAKGASLDIWIKETEKNIK